MSLALKVGDIFVGILGIDFMFLFVLMADSYARGKNDEEI